MLPVNLQQKEVKYQELVNQLHQREGQGDTGKCLHFPYLIFQREKINTIKANFELILIF